MGRTQNRRRVRYPVLNLQAARSEIATTGRRCRLEALERRFVLSGASASEAGGWFAQLQGENEAGTTADRWIVRLTDEALGSAATVAEAATRLTSAEFPLYVVRGLGLPGQLLVESSGVGTLQVAAWLAANPAVAYFQADSLLSALTAPNDPLYGGQIGLHNTGQTGGTSGADIDAEAAWNITTGSSSVVVAVIDSGVDLTHPDLAANLWTNLAEIPGNGLDDDGNDLIDDVQGYDFVHDASSPVDDNGHGTHVAGTIAAVGDNGLGVAGVSWHASLMVLKYLDNNLQGQTANAVLAVNYVTYQRLHNNVNVRVINASWGDPNSNPALKDAIEQAGAAGILLVAAAGNGDALSHGLNLDQGNAFYPASYDLSNIISVAASTQDDTLAGFSNYGPTSVDLVAPGVGILSTLPGGNYGTLNGTSMAAPQVTGAAALVFANKPNASVSEVRNAILQGVDLLPDLTGKVATGGRLNAYKALTAPTFAPSAVMDAVVEITDSSSDHQTITVTYTGEVALDPASIDANDLEVTRDGFAATTLQVTMLGMPIVIDTPTLHQITASYQVLAPVAPENLATNWDATDNGTYRVVLRANQVRELSATPLATPRTVLGAFVVSIYDPFVWFVNTTDDSVGGVLSHGLISDATSTPTSSLRAAIIEANSTPGSHTIIVPDGLYNLTLAGAEEDASATGDLDITGSISIWGDAPRSTALTAPTYTTIAGGGLDRVFDVLAGGYLVLKGAMVTEGFAAHGGGIRNAGQTIVVRATITGNTGVIDGGGVANSGNLTLFQTTVSFNQTTDLLGGSGGGVYATTTTLISASTFQGNIGGGQGGGGLNFYYAPGTADQSLDIINSTFSGNIALHGRGGGIAIGSDSLYSNSYTITNCTVLDNRADLEGVADIYGGAVIKNTVAGEIVGSFYAGYNLFESGGPFAEWLTFGPNQTFVDPKVSPLQDNRGPTLTYLPLANSPLLDSGLGTNSPGVPTYDQVGQYVRNPVNSDIGSVERIAATIRGRMFIDLNGNDQLDSNENGLGGQTVYLDLNTNGQFDLDEPNTVTANDDPNTPLIIETGLYEFSVVPSQSQQPYLVSRLLPTQFSPTAPKPGFQSISKISVDPVVTTDTLFPQQSDPFNTLFVPPALDGARVAFLATQAGNLQKLYSAAGPTDVQTVRDIGAVAPFLGTTDFSYQAGDFAIASSSLSPDELVLVHANGTHTVVVDDNTLIPGSSETFAGYEFLDPTVVGGSVLFQAKSPAGVVALYQYLTNGTLIKRADISTSIVNQAANALAPEHLVVINKAVLSEGGASFGYDSINENGSRTINYYNGIDTRVLVHNNVADVGNSAVADSPIGGERYSSFGNSISMTDSVISFIGYGESGTIGVYHAKRVAGGGTDLRRVADNHLNIPNSSDYFTDFQTVSSGPSFYVFTASGSGGQKGIYAEANGLLRRIVDLSNAQFFGGKTPIDFVMGDDAVDGNRIAFGVQFADGSSGVYVASVSLESARIVPLSTGQEELSVNLGALPQPGQIRGTVYEDLDKNGLRSLGEPGVAGFTIFLDQNANGVLNPGEKSTISDANGQYAFTNLAPFVNYRVIEQPLAGWSVTTPHNGKWVVPLGAGQSVQGDDFGNFHGATGGGVSTQGALSGKLFGDANGNGRQDVAESGLAGWTVFLDANGNGALDTNEVRSVTVADNPATSGVNESGNYQFSGLVGGSYKVRVVQQSGYVQSSPVGNTLSPLPNRSTGVQPQQGSAGDFNGDGFADLVVPNSGSNDLTIFTNNGVGSLNAGQTVLFAAAGIANGTPQVGYSPAASIVGDFNNDGKDDIAVPNIDSTNVAILLNTTSAIGSAPSFNTATIRLVDIGGTGPIGLTTGDFNRDGFLDIAVAAEYGDKVVILLNRGLLGPGSFVVGSAAAVGDSPVAITAAQLNDDNLDGQINALDYLDLAVTSYTGNSITLLRGSGTGTFSIQAGTLPTGAQPASIVTGDFNHDDRPDLAVANLTSTSITVFLHSAAAFGFASPQNYSLSGTSNVASLVAADIDRDGNLDLAASTGATGSAAKVYILHNQGSGLFVPLSDVSVGSGTLNTLQAVFVAAADLDHDARQTPDLMVISGLSNTVTVLNNNLTLGSYQLSIGGTETIANLNFGLTAPPNAALIVDRKMFYNRSKFDGNDPAANSADDGAIATNKAALLPGGTATFANYNSYNRGINGLMIDVSNLAGTPTVADFTFRVGNDNSPNAWATAPAPQSIVIRAGAGTGGSSRIELIWADGTIKKTWLQVTLLATANTGLTQPDVFYFGNAVGDAGNQSTNARVNSTDEILARNNARSFDNLAPIDFAFDYDRDGFVNATDQILSRSNGTTLVTGLKLISVPASLSMPASLSVLAEPGQSLSATAADPSAALPVPLALAIASSNRRPQPLLATHASAVDAALGNPHWPERIANSFLSNVLSIQAQLRPATGRRVCNQAAAEAVFAAPGDFDTF